MTAVWTDTGWNVTLNVVEIAPMWIVTVAGKLADAEDELSATVAPSANAAAVSVAVQLEPPGGVTEAGLQERALKTGVLKTGVEQPQTSFDSSTPAGRGPYVGAGQLSSSAPRSGPAPL